MGKDKAKFKEGDIIRIYDRIEFSKVTYCYYLITDTDHMGYYLKPLNNIQDKYVAHEYCEKYYEQIG